MKLTLSRGARAGLLLLLGLIPCAMSAQDRKIDVVKIAEDVYTMVEGTSSNSTFIITPDGVVVFDHFMTQSEQTLAAIRKLTNKKVVYLFSSHAAIDHASGAWWFREDKPAYIATRVQLTELLGPRGALYKAAAESSEPRNAVYKGKALVLPDIVFDKSLVLRLGGITFEATFEGYAHSPGDLTVYIPQKRVFLMGDLLNTELHAGGGSLMPGDGSSPRGWIDVLGNIMERRLPVDTYVPGHGPVHIGRGVKDLEEAQRYFVVMREAVSKMMSEGKGLDQIIKEFKVPAEIASYGLTDRLKTTLPLFYYELMGVEK